MSAFVSHITIALDIDVEREVMHGKFLCNISGCDWSHETAFGISENGRVRLNAIARLKKHLSDVHNVVSECKEADAQTSTSHEQGANE